MKTRKFFALVALASLLVAVLSAILFPEMSEIAMMAAFPALGGAVNPATEKLSRMNQKFGLKNANKMQGTSRELYDTLPLDPLLTEYDFFTECNSRRFPDTNLTATGNKLPVGDTFAMQGFYLSFISETKSEGREIEYGTLTLMDKIFAFMRLAEIDFYVGNSRVIKDLPLSGCLSFANRFAQSDKIIYLLDTPLIIPQDIQFYARIRSVKAYLNIAENQEYKIRLSLSGMGGIINLRSTI